MKIKREYIVLATLILAISLYLIFRSTNKMQYELPRLADMQAGDVDRLLITHGQDTLNLSKSGSEWKILPEQYPADKDQVAQMIDHLVNLSLADLVSESSSYKRYELDDVSRITVTAYDGSTVLRQCDVGKSASSYQYSYVRVPGDSRVFTAQGDIRSAFDKDKEALRDKLVLSFETDTISIINAESSGRSVSLNKRIIPDRNAEGQESESQTVVQWETTEGEVWDTGKVDQLLGTLSRLDCSEYVTDGSQTGEPFFSISLTGDKEYSLTLYEPADDKYPGASSGSDYLFLLSSWQGDDISGFLDDPAEQE